MTCQGIVLLLSLRVSFLLLGLKETETTAMQATSSTGYTSEYLICQQWNPPPYGHLDITVTNVIKVTFFLARQNGHTFLYKNPSLMWSPTNTANGHILKSLTVDVFYNFTPFIRPLIRNRKIKMPVSCQFH